MLTRKRASEAHSPPAKCAAPLLFEQLPADVVHLIALAGGPEAHDALAATCKRVHQALRAPHRLKQAAQVFLHTSEFIFRDGGRRRTQSLASGLQHGEETMTNSSGSVIRRSQWRFGKKHGTDECWNDAGARTHLAYWVDGKQHGTAEWWNAAGNRVYLAHWVNGKLQDTIEHWNAAGTRTYLAHWVDDKRHGIEMRWNDAGDLTEISHWDNGVRIA